jgi:hypothetical protein
MLDKQRHIYQELANNVLTEEFYKSSDIHLEKKKFNSFTNEIKNKEILALRNKIKDKNGERNNKNDNIDNLVQRARQRMMKRNHSNANANKKFNCTYQHKSSLKFNTTIINNNLNKGNLSTSKIKENSNSPNASIDIQIDSNNNSIPQTHPNKDCNFFILFYIIFSYLTIK